MDQQASCGRSPSSPAGQSQHQQEQLVDKSQNAHSPPSGTDALVGLGLGLDHQLKHQRRQPFTLGAAGSTFESLGTTADCLDAPPPPQPYVQPPAVSDPAALDTSVSFGHEPPDAVLSFDSHPQSQSAAYLSPNLDDGDFSLFPPSAGQGDQLNASLFERSSLSPSDLNVMSSPHSHHSTTPPSLLQPDGHLPSSAQHSPSLSHHLSSPPGGHSRNVSLGPEAALLSNQLGDWTQPKFQRHRRSPSEYSDVSSVCPSPNLVSSDSFDGHGGHSPLQRASDRNLYQEVLGIGTFSIADTSQGQHGRSPSHSPAISPRILPQHLPNMNQTGFGLAPPSAGYGMFPAFQQVPDSPFPSVQTPGRADVAQMAPPSINIDFAPNNAKAGSFEPLKPHMDQDSLTPPERGRTKSRPRSVTDPFHPGTGSLGRSSNSGSLAPSAASGLAARPELSRSLSPLDRQATSCPRGRRQSTSAVPNNVIALRLADPDHQSSQDAGYTKRIQKHPATFQCTLCPKRFTRAYNLRSHLRTHTDERPFVCTVCGKAFARQHDRKRHESLHSGEKKFVCKGDLKAGGQWGCGRRFARADALGRHFRSEAGRICIKSLLDEEMIERQRLWQEQRMQHNMAHNMAAPQPMAVDTVAGYPTEAGGNYMLPAALLAQYPALAQMNWSQQDPGGAMDDDLSGRSSFDASDYDEGDDGGYVSGPNTGFGNGSMDQKFGEMENASDFSGR